MTLFTGLWILSANICRLHVKTRKTYGEIRMLLIVNKFNVWFTLDPRLVLSERPCFFPYITLVNPLGFNHTTLGVPIYTLLSKHTCMPAQSITSVKHCVHSMNGVKCSSTNHTSAEGTAGEFMKYLVSISLVTYSYVWWKSAAENISK